jgi:hypothetical protein
MTTNDKRLNFTALAGHSGDVYDTSLPYFGRNWGDHPDLRSYDGRSQSQSVAPMGKKSDSRFDRRYQDNISLDGSLRTQ